MANGHLNVVLCWHMHQPWYRDGVNGDYQLPWVYLHAIKDYSDMVAHLERHPNMRAVVNFAPVLLEQLDDYSHQMSAFLDKGTRMKDALLNSLIGFDPIPNEHAARLKLLQECQRCHAPCMITPHSAFSELLSLSGANHESRVKPAIVKDQVSIDESLPNLLHFSDQYFLDVLTWYHLAWLGQSLHADARVKRLLEKGQCFDQEDRLALLEVMRDCISGLIERYRVLAERKQIELSMTPYMHPIIPLLNDFGNMRDALPDAPVPNAQMYPMGELRSRWHLEKGFEIFEHYFGMKPQGVWLSEGGVSSDALDLLQDYAIRWTASGEGVWRASCHKSGMHGDHITSKRALFQPYHLQSQLAELSSSSDISSTHNPVAMYFRDDGLSDMIGFKYSGLNADEAVQDFVGHLENIAGFLGDTAEEQVVSIILDGENAWEYYPDNGFAFLDQLYAALSSNDAFSMTTYADISTRLPMECLPVLSAGSWVYGSFSTWIGSEDKNRGWDYLVQAKVAYDGVLESGCLNVEQIKQATQQLAVCEGSDWFWWFGDYNASDSVSDFEQLYRQQLKRLYHCLELAAPDHLDIPLSQGSGTAEHAGTMRRN